MSDSEFAGPEHEDGPLLQATVADNSDKILGEIGSAIRKTSFRDIFFSLQCLIFL